MRKQKKSRLYRLIRWLVKTCYRKIRVVGQDQLPEESVILVGNHCQIHGPITSELYAPGLHYTWCIGDMMDRKTVPAYAFRTFWSQKKKSVRWFYKLLSSMIGPLAECIFNNANTIGVYHDSRVLSTFKHTVQRLQEGANIVIFPESDDPYSNIVNRYQDRFIDVARLYYRRTGKQVQFVPFYLAPELKTLCIGKPIRYRPDADPAGERNRICTYLMEESTHLGRQLPEHTVIPYNIMPKDRYPSNKEVSL